MSEKKQKTMRGTVVKKSGDKTVAVEVVGLRTHRLYGKKMKHTKRYLVHDPNNSAVVGMVVTIRATRPLSAKKRWVLIQ